MNNSTKKSLITEAMKENKNYDNLYRIIEPHCIGKHKSSHNIVLRAYQIGGDSKSNHNPPWRLLDISKINNLKIIEQNSQAPREGYKKNDRHMREIYYEI